MATPQGLPRETFAKLSPHPYLLANLQTPQAAGDNDTDAALVRIGDNTVICGIRGEILPTANIPNYRASIRDSDARAADDEDDDMGELEAGERVVIAYWVLYIDIYFISFDGNPFDAAWAAMLAALRNTKLPAARWDQDREIVVCSRAEQKPLTLSGFPIATSAAVFQGKEPGRFWTLVDPDRLEETLCRENLTVVVDKNGGETRLLSVSKHGGTTLQPKLVGEFVAVAERRWDEFRRVMT
ncbi:Exosome complex component rrp43 like protein [Verticillium longisporum]|uniref:Exosome complex component rrp43 like protein n=1 Tax=Verticillium longisporum TaxID=100787 RepID=A0A8I2ZT85_VERLO|nr:Exosome complex component rrp43 like protein [Verticillium longisporum]